MIKRGEKKRTIMTKINVTENVKREKIGQE